MIVLMEAESGREALAAVLHKAEEMGLHAEIVEQGPQCAIVIKGAESLNDRKVFQQMPGVARIIALKPIAGLVGKSDGVKQTVVRVGEAEIGGGSVAVIAGPCAVESMDQAMAVAETVAKSGVKIFRAGAFKPRTSPYSFQGLGEEGLRILVHVRDETGLRIVTEALDRESLGLVAQYADMVQIGSRNMQNYQLLRAAGRLKKPVLLKRGMAATLEEWLMAAEYILAEGNSQVVLCERGVRTFSDHSRFTIDLGVIPAVRELSHLPVIVDPSHGTGISSRVPAMARAAVAAGADGVMLEVHPRPEAAFSDGSQSLDPGAFVSLMDELHRIANALGLRL
jgi:3-deoxy-7-phosphoheptulonate synthase